MGDSFGIDFPFFFFFFFSCSFLSSSSARTHSHMFSFLSIIIVLCSSLFFFLFYGENSIFRSLFFLGFLGGMGESGDLQNVDFVWSHLEILKRPLVLGIA